MKPRGHWEKVYGTKRATEVSWYQPTPDMSLRLLRTVVPDHAVPIIDVGGGASTLVDGLLADGYTNITVLDVSASALKQAAERLGASAASVMWREANVLDCTFPPAAYAVWHDRAVFHFLTDPADRERYVAQVRVGGHVIVATFATDGPLKCSGLEVARYSPDQLHAQFGSDFQLLESVREEHHTPTGLVQPFIYCMCRVKGGLTTA